MRRKISTMDTLIDENLREEKVIGKVSSIHRDKIHFKPRNVSFSWQRGFKIGEYCTPLYFCLIFGAVDMLYDKQLSVCMLFIFFPVCFTVLMSLLFANQECSCRTSLKTLYFYLVSYCFLK